MPSSEKLAIAQRNLQNNLVYNINWIIFASGINQTIAIMEERNISAQESLEIITSMINNSRKRLHLGDGNILLLWGYLTVATQ